MSFLDFLKGAIKANPKGAKLILYFFIAPIIFVNILFFFGGGAAGFAIFVTFPLALVLTPIITIFLDVYMSRWIKDENVIFETILTIIALCYFVWIKVTNCF